jgi:hypothetical protein
MSVSYTGVQATVSFQPRHPFPTHANNCTDCKVNLRRYKDDSDLQEHFDRHLSNGEALPQAIARRIPRTLQALLPLPPKGAQQCHEILASWFTAPAFRPSTLAKAKQRAEQPDPALNFRVGSYILGDWQRIEWDDSPSEVKPRELRDSRRAACHLVQRRPMLHIPPPLSNEVPRPHISVGFDSIGFRVAAQAAFDLVEAESSSDSEAAPSIGHFDPDSD